MRGGPRRALFLVAVVGAGFLACSRKSNTTTPDYSNHPPEITGIVLSPTRVHVHQRIHATVAAFDPDGDRLSVRWRASRGSFPEGNGTSSVIWQSPDVWGVDTLVARVSDILHEVTQDFVVAPVGIAPPDSLRYTSSPSSVVLRWRRSADDPVVAGVDTTGYSWRGYEVFRATRSFAEIPDSEAIYYRVNSPAPWVPGNSVRVTGLESGVRYWFRVSARRSWADQIRKSAPSQEIDLAPRPEWNLEVSEVKRALDLSAGLDRSLDPEDISGVDDRDVYFGTVDPLDVPDTLCLKSVSLLSNRRPEWGAREVQIQAAGRDWQIGTVPAGEWSRQVKADVGEVYVMHLPEGNYAKLQIVSIRGYPPFRQIQLRWAYQLIPEYANF
jgi:hypothetical protein